MLPLTSNPLGLRLRVFDRNIRGPRVSWARALGYSILPPKLRAQQIDQSYGSFLSGLHVTHRVD